MGKHIGIDLGTTNTVAAIMNGKRPMVLSHQTHQILTPSVVYAQPDGERIAGSLAKDRSGEDPENTVISVKRLVGRQFEDPNVQIAKGRFQYPIVKNPSGADVMVRLQNKLYSPTQISADILRQVKHDAERVLKEEVTHAVITVPAHFDPIQKEQTRKAGELAGLRVKKVIVEPTAAAIAYHMDRDELGAETIVVFDLGGGTFDVTCLLAVNGMHDGISMEGDPWLGGDDFDQVLIDYCLADIRNNHEDAQVDTGFLYRLRKIVEEAKRELSEETTAFVQISASAISNPKRLIDIKIPIRRSVFESLIRKHVDHAIELTMKAVDRAKFSIELVDCLLLVGGSTAIPLVRDLLAEKFGEETIYDRIDPMTSVAIGAARLARDLMGITCPNPDCKVRGGHLNQLDAVKCKECGFELKPEITCPLCGHVFGISASECPECGGQAPDIILPGEPAPHSYGIEVEGKKYEIIFPRDAKYPSESPYTRRFYTASATQRAIYIPVFEGESVTDLEQNRFLGVGKILVEDGVPADTPVDISISLDHNGTLRCDAVTQYGSSKKTTFEINPSALDPSRLTYDKNWRYSIRFYWADNLCHAALERFADAMTKDQVKELVQIISDLDAADKADDPILASEAVSHCDQWFMNHALLETGDHVQGGDGEVRVWTPAPLDSTSNDMMLLARAQWLKSQPDVDPDDVKDLDELIAAIHSLIRQRKLSQVKEKLAQLRPVWQRIYDKLPDRVRTPMEVSYLKSSGG